MKLKLYFFLVCIMGGVALKAQDATFSQFYANPLYLNPALTGNFNGFWRATGIYRNQWLGVAKGTAPFSTPSVGVDFSLLKEQLKDKGALGVGAVFLNDQLYGKVITYNKFLVNVAYTMKIAKKVQIGLGFQGGIQTQKLKDNFNFADEVDPATLEFSLNTSEVLNSQTQIRENINAGVFVSAELIRGMRFYTGYSINNLSRQKESYLNTGPTNRVDFRHVSHGGFEFDLGQSAVLIPGWLFSLQSKTLQTNWGLTAGIHVKKSTVPADRATLYLGLWNRVNRDYPQTVQLIPKVGFEWKGFRAGFAFDAPLGQLRKDSKAAGGGYPQAFEISLSYIGQIVIPREDNYLFNPRY
jgi:type IX secretion system PorP/SprF family membrane protein